MSRDLRPFAEPNAKISPTLQIAETAQGLHRRRLHDCEQSVWRGSEGDGGQVLRVVLNG